MVLCAPEFTTSVFTTSPGFLYQRPMVASEADSPRVRIERWPLGPELGQCCGGSVTLWFERLTGDDAAFLDTLQARLARGERVRRVRLLGGLARGRPRSNGSGFCGTG